MDPQLALRAFAAITTLQEIRIYCLRTRCEQLEREVKRQNRVARYLANMIDAHDVPISEFDKIALSNIANS
jgi:hypothetical protein